MFALLIIAMGPTRAEEPQTVAALTALYKADTKDLIGAVVMSGVEAQKLPLCTQQLNLPELTGKILGWWLAHPDQAANSVAQGLVNALNALKPC